MSFYYKKPVYIAVHRFLTFDYEKLFTVNDKTGKVDKGLMLQSII